MRHRRQQHDPRPERPDDLVKRLALELRGMEEEVRALRAENTLLRQRLRDSMGRG